MVIEICNKECENDVNGKESIDNVVYDEQCVMLLMEKGKLKRANPCRVNNKDNEQHLPGPVTRIKRGNCASSKPCFLVDSGSKGWQEIIRKKAAIRKTCHLKLVNTEPLEKLLTTAKWHGLRLKQKQYKLLERAELNSAFM